MTYIAFLRAINVGGRVVKMDVLRTLFESLGYSNVETFIASGNVIFETPSRSPRSLEKAIEKRLHEKLGYEVHTFVRTCEEVAAIVAYEAFSSKAVEQASAFVVGFLVDPLDASSTKTLLALKSDVDDSTSTAARSTGCAGANRASPRFRTRCSRKRWESARRFAA